VTPYIRYTWKGKLVALAILSILGVIVAMFGEVVGSLVAMGSAAAYLYFQGRNGRREAALRQLERQIDDLRLQVEVARKAFAVAASGADGVEVVEDLLQEYGIRRLEDLRPADHQDFSRELDDDVEDLKECRRAKLDELLRQTRV
jgi:hypothetical protein